MNELYDSTYHANDSLYYGAYQASSETENSKNVLGNVGNIVSDITPTIM
ncbi:hypothetical protein [Intestinibacter sp.]